jgi:hypothetical protein
MAVFWVVAPCSLVEVYQCFIGPCCLALMPEAAGTSETLALQPRRQPSRFRIFHCSVVTQVDWRGMETRRRAALVTTVVTSGSVEGGNLFTISATISF